MLPERHYRLAEIRGLTLRHPWAFCVARLGKRVENRTWHPNCQGGHVGMYLAIHGGGMPRGGALEECADDAQWVCDLINAGLLKGTLSEAERVWLLAHSPFTVGDFITPGIVAVARLAAVVQDSLSPWAVQGQYHWQLADVCALPEPVPHRGAQGLWSLEPAALERVRGQVREVRRAG